MRISGLRTRTVFDRAFNRRPEGPGNIGGCGGPSTIKPLNPKLASILAVYPFILFRSGPFSGPVDLNAQISIDSLEKQEIIGIVQQGLSQKTSLTEMYRQLLTNDRYVFIRRHLVPFVMTHAHEGLFGDETNAICGYVNAICQPRPLVKDQEDAYYSQLVTEISGMKDLNHVAEAMKANPRKFFVPQFYTDLEAALDAPMHIGYFQTISQPSLVAMILGLSGITQGSNVMEIGYGSGWLLSLLASIVGEKGQVYGAELVPQLVIWGKENVLKMGHRNVEFLGIGEHNSPSNIPSGLDAVILSAEVQNDENGLKYLGHISTSLKPGGRLIFPKDHRLFLGIMREGQFMCQEMLPRCSFVPLIIKP